MAKESIIEKEIREMRIENGLLNKIDCTPQENVDLFKSVVVNNQPLPDGVYKCAERDGYFRISPLELEKEDIPEYLMLKMLEKANEQVELTKKTNKYLCLFYVLTILSLVGGALYLLYILMLYR